MKRGVEVDEAQDWILSETPVLGGERVATAEALGRVLAEEVISSRRLPPADCSAMDGYAVRRADVAADGSSSLPVLFEVPAGGQAPRPLAPGEAARIFTGAPVPPGADAVVRQEDTEVEGDAVRILVAPGPREHIRDAGEDLDVGDVVLEPGVVLRAAHLGVLASLGRSQARVHQRPRVAILSGGDELVEPDGAVDGGRIVSSNSYSLAAQCRELGADPLYLGIASDTEESIEAHLRAGLRADVLVSSAGVSVGDYDYVRKVLEDLGCRLLFWGIHMKPGFPVAFGRFPDGGPLVFGLPGNPVSAMVTFEQFVRPVLLKLQGHAQPIRGTVTARLAHPLEKKPGRMHFVRVALAWRDGELVAESTGNQSSGVLTSLVAADGLAIFPKEAARLDAGAPVQVQVLDPRLAEGPERGF